MNGRIKTGFPILDDILGGGVREGLVILRCEGVPCAWVAECIVEHLHRNAQGDYDVTTAREDSEQARIDAHMTGRVAVAIRCGYEVTQETRIADLILEIKSVDGGYEVRVAKHRNGRIGGVAMASDNGDLYEVCALPAPIVARAPFPPSLVSMESDRWETAMRGVADDLTRRDQACQRLIAANGIGEDRLTGKASAYAHAAEMIRAAIASMKETP